MKKKYVYILSILIILLIITSGASKMRKEFPYDIEIVPANNAIWIINITDWADRDCSVFIEDGKGQDHEDVLPSHNKIIKMDGLTNGTSYNVQISRKDILGKIKYKKFATDVTPTDQKGKYVVLVGASVGKSWNLNRLADRIKKKKIFYGYRGRYSFDKTYHIKKMSTSPLKADAVIIKECAAYFPYDTSNGMEEIKRWVDMLNRSDIKPILATVVPVTKAHDQNRKTSRMKSINAFNEAIREFGEQNKIPVLDLQKVLSAGHDNGYLNESFAVQDGLHIKESTYYNVLDSYLSELMENIVNPE